MNKPKIICLCGSTKFYKEFSDYNYKFTLDRCIVLTVGCDTKSDDELFKNLGPIRLKIIKKKLDELHLRKIDICDEVFVLNVNGYIGESTRNEIEYAKKINKPIKYLEQIK